MSLAISFWNTGSRPAYTTTAGLSNWLPLERMTRATTSTGFAVVTVTDTLALVASAGSVVIGPVANGPVEPYSPQRSETVSPASTAWLSVTVRLTMLSLHVAISVSSSGCLGTGITVQAETKIARNESQRSRSDGFNRALRTTMPLLSRHGAIRCTPNPVVLLGANRARREQRHRSKVVTGKRRFQCRTSPSTT